MSYDLIELTLSRLGDQSPQRSSPCVESHQTHGSSDKSRSGISRQSEEACPVLLVYTRRRDRDRSTSATSVRVFMGDKLGHRRQGHHGVDARRVV